MSDIYLIIEFIMNIAFESVLVSLLGYKDIKFKEYLKLVLAIFLLYFTISLIKMPYYEVLILIFTELIIYKVTGKHKIMQIATLIMLIGITETILSYVILDYLFFSITVTNLKIVYIFVLKELKIKKIEYEISKISYKVLMLISVFSIVLMSSILNKF